MPVENELHTRTECGISEDSRLLPAISAIVEQASMRIGMPDTRIRALILASEHAFRRMCVKSNGNGHVLRVTCQDYDDRVEVTVEGPAASKTAADAAVIELRDCVGRVIEEAQGENIRLTLTEFTGNNGR